jgi:predicted nucleotidyltransferase
MVAGHVIAAARAICSQRYPELTVAFAAGSLMRGEGTPYSDLDLVVIYPRLSCAFRESFRFEGLPVEAFVHDADTLNYFFTELDRVSGVPSLPRMVLEGVEIPETNDTSRALKALAASVVAAGPPGLSSPERDKRRYTITDLVDDLRAPRSPEEQIATGALLLPALADYYFRARGMWSATGKAIPGALLRADRTLSARFSRGFDALFKRGEPDAVIALAEELLQADGGLLFDGYRLDAPPEWRQPIPRDEP